MNDPQSPRGAISKHIWNKMMNKKTKQKVPPAYRQSGLGDLGVDSVGRAGGRGREIRLRR